MSRIQTVKKNYQQNSQKQNVSKSNFASSQNFGGGNPTGLADDALVVYKAVEKQSVGKFTKLGEFLAKNDSEIEKQLINALFTATLAPVVIGYNPFSKQDEKTKKYMALRQPISAVVAIAGGVAMTKPIDDFLAKIATEGVIPSIDMRVVPDKNYLKSQFKKELNKAEDKKAFLTALNPKDVKVEDADGTWKQKQKYKKACVEAYVKKVQDERKEIFTVLASENPENIVMDEATSTIKLKDSGKIIGKDIPNINTQVELNKYLDSNNLHKLSFGDFLKEHLKFEFFDDGKLKPHSLEKNLREIKAMAFLEKLGIKGFDEEELGRVLGIVDQNKENKNMGNIFEPSAFKPQKGEQDLHKALGSLIARANQRQHGGTKNYTMTLEQLFQHLGYVQGNSNKCCTEKIQALMDCNVSEVLEILKGNGDNIKGHKGLLKGVKGLSGLIVDQKDGKAVTIDNKKILDIAKNIMERKIELLGTKFKAYKGYVGIISNLFIVVVTCTALNWIYPRLVEALFPNLVKNDAPKGGNK